MSRKQFTIREELSAGVLPTSDPRSARRRLNELLQTVAGDRTVTGATGGNAALESLLAVLDAAGIIDDQTS